jgi:hypothetical protein
VVLLIARNLLRIISDLAGREVDATPTRDWSKLPLSADVIVSQPTSERSSQVELCLEVLEIESKVEDIGIIDRLRLSLARNPQASTQGPPHQLPLDQRCGRMRVAPHQDQLLLAE